MKRYGMQIGLRPEAYDEYKRYHSAVWPEVLATIERCNIRNYTIYHHGGVLFAHFEYHGADYKADMALMAADAATQRWWAIMMPFQERLPGHLRASGGCRWRRCFTSTARGEQRQVQTQISFGNDKQGTGISSGNDKQEGRDIHWE